MYFFNCLFVVRNEWIPIVHQAFSVVHFVSMRLAGQWTRSSNERSLPIYIRIYCSKHKYCIYKVHTSNTQHKIFFYIHAPNARVGHCPRNDRRDIPAASAKLDKGLSGNRIQLFALCLCPPNTHKFNKYICICAIEFWPTRFDEGNLCILLEPC